MKKSVILIILALIISSNSFAVAHPHNGRCYRGSHSSSCSVYLVRTDFSQTQTGFANCKEHALLTETTVNYFSDGTKRTFVKYSILNADGTTMLTNCSSVSHIIHEKQHYFLVKQGKYANILNSEGIKLNHRKYTYLKEIAPNKLIAKADKRYGVINLKEDILVPLKYNEFEPAGENLFITKLNGYYGVQNINGEILFDNSYDKISPLYDTFVLKKFDKYGLINYKGDTILDVNQDKIKKLKEYILVKNANGTFVYDSTGKLLSSKPFKKIKLKRNTLTGLNENKIWEKINVSL